MIPLAVLCQGMRVCTPTGAIARVEGFAISTSDKNPMRVKLLFLDGRDCEPLLARILRPYRGPPVMFADELVELQRKYAQVSE